MIDYLFSFFILFTNFIVIIGTTTIIIIVIIVIVFIYSYKKRKKKEKNFNDFNIKFNSEKKFIRINNDDNND